MADKEYVDIFEEQEKNSNFWPTFGKSFVKGLDTPKDFLVDLPLGVAQGAANIVSGKPVLEDTLPNVPGFEDAMYFLTSLEEAHSENDVAKWSGMLAGGLPAAGATIAILNKIKAGNKPLYRKLTKMYPFSVGQFHVAATAKPNSPGWMSKIHNMFKGTIPTKKVMGKVAGNIMKLGRMGSYAGLVMGMADPVADWLESDKRSIEAGWMDPKEIRTGATTWTDAEKEKHRANLLNSLPVRMTSGASDWLRENIGTPKYGGYETQEEQNAAEATNARLKLQQINEEKKREQEDLVRLLEELNAGSADRDEMLQAKKDGGIIHRAYGSPEEGEIGSGIAGDDPYFDLKELDLGPAFEGVEDLDIFEEAKKEGYEEVQVAGLGKELFGKVPIWAVGGVDKAKMLLQNLSKNEKNILRSITEKLGLKTEKGKKVEDVVEDIDIIDTPAGGQEVVMKKAAKTISDSPEDAESAFYSSVEAKMMDPNTPESFASVDDFYKFLNKRGISRAELEDNILSRYIASAKKNETPLIKEEMLDIIRQSPLRKIRTKNYGYLGETGDTAKYADGNMESGYIPNTYRESVLYLDSKDIPLDPGKLPTEFGSTHSFPDRYVIGWSRLSDRVAKIPVEKGIVSTIDPKEMKTIARNVKKVGNQVDGLYASAYSKLFRKGEIDLQPIDQLSKGEIKDIVNQFTFDLEALDAPLFRQIKQFEDKLTADTFKLNQMKEAVKGAEVRVTFADEIQSDVLQNAQRQSEKFMKTFGDLLDKSAAERSAAILRAKSSYSSDLGKIDPAVAEYFIQNKSVFRPIFQTEQEMQQFIDVFAKNKVIFQKLKEAGVKADPDLLAQARAGQAMEKKMLDELQVSLSKEAMMQLQPNVPFKNRSEWGETLIKRDLYEAAKLLFQDKKSDAATWYAISPSKLIRTRYGQSGSVATPKADRTKSMKGIGMDEFYGGPDATDEFGKHYTSVLEKALKRAAQENNSIIKIIKVKIGPNKYTDAFAIKLTPEMLLPHKTHRKDGGMVYTPEIIDIFEAA